MPASRLVRSASVQKAFWLRKGLAKRLRAVVRARRQADERTFSERRALALAIRLFVEQEEKRLGIEPTEAGAGLLELLSETLDSLGEIRSRVERLKSAKRA